MKITETNGKISIDTPYNPEFVTKIKKAGAKWDGASKTWQMDARNIESARAIMREVYGQDDQPTETVSIRVKLTRYRLEDHGPVVMFGRVIARAWGRDTGAKVGEGVCFEIDGPDSGGSVKNWQTEVPTGAVFVMHDVPKILVDNCTEANVEIEVIGSNNSTCVVDAEKLAAEKAALLARIAEIDSLLASQ